MSGSSATASSRPVRKGSVRPAPDRWAGISTRVLELLDEQAETVRVDGNYFKARLEQLEQMPANVRALDERRKALTAEVGTLERKLAKVQLAVVELQQTGRELATKEQRRAVLAGEIAAIPAGYDASRHAQLKSEADRLLPLDVRATHLGALVEREPQLAQERARVEAAAGAVFAASQGDPGAAGRHQLLREGVPGSAGPVRARVGRRARRRDRGGHGARRGHGSAGARWSGPRWPGASSTSCSTSWMCCSGTSGCTMSWTARSRT